MKTFLLSTAMVVAGATAGVAQSFTGAEIGLEYQSFNDFDESVTSYFGGAEFTITPQFAVAADLSLYSNSASDDNANSFTLHGIYKTGARSGFGLFIGQDSTDDADVDLFGADAAFDFGQGRVEAYIGAGEPEDSDTEVSFFGAEFEYDLGRGIEVIGGLDRVNYDISIADLSVTTLEIGGSYMVADMVSIFGKIGTIELDGDGFASEDDSFLSIGAEIGFGPNQGLTFSPRSIFSSAPLAF